MRVPGAAVAAALSGGEIAESGALSMGKSYGLYPDYVYQVSQPRAAPGVGPLRPAYSRKYTR